jgi:hypothetical protein
MKHNLQIGQDTQFGGITAEAVVVCEGTVAAEAAAGDTMSFGGSIG